MSLLFSILYGIVVLFSYKILSKKSPIIEYQRFGPLFSNRKITLRMIAFWNLSRIALTPFLLAAILSILTIPLNTHYVHIVFTFILVTRANAYFVSKFQGISYIAVLFVFMITPQSSVSIPTYIIAIILCEFILQAISQIRKTIPKSVKNIPVEDIKKINQKEFADLTILIKTFIRYDSLYYTLNKFREVLPEVPIIIVDDSPTHLRKKINAPNVKQIFTDPDIGVSEGRNIGIKAVKTKYIFYTDDDAYPLMSRKEIAHNYKLVSSGRYDFIGADAAFFKTFGKRVKICVEKTSALKQVDLTAIMFISTKKFLIKHPFLDECKNDGDHFAFFYLLKQNGGKVYSSPTMRFNNTMSRNPEYTKYRNRTSYRQKVLNTTGIKEFWWG